MSKQGYNTGYSTSNSTAGIIDRRRHFLEAVQQYKPATKDKIINYLEDCGDIISESTFYRIRSEFEEQMGIDIHFDKTLGGYVIAKSSEESVRSFIEMSSLSIDNGQLQRSLVSHPKLYEYVLMDEYPQSNKSGAMHTILEAIRLNRKVKIHYVKFHGDGDRNYHSLEPHYIKKYLGRWYFFSYAPWIDETMTLAIDQRLEKVEMQEETFERKEERFEWVKDLIGLNTAQAKEQFDISKPILIEFEIKKTHADYINGLPLHPSQVFLGEGEEKGSEKYSVYLLPNYELVQAFLRMGDQVKILSPDFFVEYFREIFRRIQQNYS